MTRESAPLQSPGRVLFVYAHPNHSKSRANRKIADRVRELEHLKFVDLYAEFPDFAMSEYAVREQQSLLRSHDVLFIQHPMYWYSMPALLKLWLDEVFLSGFAYGQGEMALRGKTLQISMTTGGGAEAYTPQGFHGRSFDEFLYPWKQTARLIEMKFAEPLVLHAAARSSDDELLIHAEKVRDRAVSYTLPGYVSQG